MRSIVYTFCCDLNRDPVSARVLHEIMAQNECTETDMVVDGKPVLLISQADTEIFLMRIDTVLSHDYRRYADTINACFSRVDAVVIVNWHEGAKAPNAIFTVQTTGDMKSGHFSAVDPRISRGLYLAIESERERAGLLEFTTWMEATHWSGVIYGQQAGETVSQIIPSVIDVEIGSCPDDWANPKAIKVLAAALPRVFETWNTPTTSILCMGGIHFEPSFTDPLRAHGLASGIAITHILPNHWLVAENYHEPQRLNDLLSCAKSVKDGVDLIVFHDNLKGAFKDQAKALGAALGVPVLSHKALRTKLAADGKV